MTPPTYKGPAASAFIPERNNCNIRDVLFVRVDHRLAQKVMSSVEGALRFSINRKQSSAMSFGFDATTKQSLV
jgi:hypothetical protein